MFAVKSRRSMPWYRLLLAMTSLWFLAGPSTLCAADVQPKKLLIYYGWPSHINGASSVAGAAMEFARYDYLILGDGLEKAIHPDHLNAMAILADPHMANTRVFGYIDLGGSTQNLPMDEVFKRVDEWTAAGAYGIFFDDFGYDFLTTRIRQNTAVRYAHSRGRAVTINAFRPADAFSATSDRRFNPYGLRCVVGPSDFYLYESHQIQVGAYLNEATWQAKANTIKSFQDVLGFKVLSTTTSDMGGSYDARKFFYSWYSALLYGHEATGWGELYYSAASASAPFRDRPVTAPGSVYTGPVVNISPQFTRTTNLGMIIVNTATHDAGFGSH